MVVRNGGWERRGVWVRMAVIFELACTEKMGWLIVLVSPQMFIDHGSLLQSMDTSSARQNLTHRRCSGEMSSLDGLSDAVVMR